MTTVSSASVGRRIQELRTLSGRTIARLARDSGVAVKQIEEIERGRARPSLGVLVDIASALRTPLPKLIAGAEALASRKDALVKQTMDLSTRLDRIARAIVELPADLGSKLDAAEVAVVRHAMLVCDGNQSAAARLLGIERKALVRRWQRIRRESKRK